jgi:hypothetical protein
MSFLDALSRAFSRLLRGTASAEPVMLVLRRYRSVAIHGTGTLEGDRTQSVYIERLMGLLRISDSMPPITQDCVIDTGAYLSLFPEKTWKRFSSHVEWLDKDGAQLPEWLCRVKGTTGGSVPCRPGLIRIQILDLESHALMPTTIVALFAADNGLLKHVVLGIGGGVFDHRRFVLVYDARSAWLAQA